MFQAEGVILEWAVKVGHGWMARIARFREQAQISEHQFAGQPGPITKLGVRRRLAMAAIQQHQGAYDAATCCEYEKQVCFAHNRYPFGTGYSNAFRMAGVISFRRTTRVPR